MKELIITPDQHDDEHYHVYELSNGKPWRKVFTLFVDDVATILGEDVFEALTSELSGSSKVKFKLPEAQEVETL